MILDTGVCTIFRKVDTAMGGEMPRPAFERIWSGWYGELSFETSPARPTENRRELKTDARIRVLQCRAIRQNDVVALENLSEWAERTAGEPVYRITRVWHGADDGGPTPVSDLSLEVTRP